MRVVLKSTYSTHNLTDYNKCIEDFGNYLKEQGWIEDIMEGGIISPNLSTIYYTSREPYIGQLLQFSPNKKQQYENTLKELKQYFIIERGV